MFMTLGTKGIIIDLNTPVLDMSQRFLNRSSSIKNRSPSIPTPTFFNWYPIRKIKPSYRFVTESTNVQVSCDSRPRHGKFPVQYFDLFCKRQTRKMAVTTTWKAYFLPVWMVRTGILGPTIPCWNKTLVANNMATLFDTSKDLSSMTVSYPSEPILAMASHYNY